MGTLQIPHVMTDGETRAVIMAAMMEMDKGKGVEQSDVERIVATVNKMRADGAMAELILKGYAAPSWAKGKLCVRTLSPKEQAERRPVLDRVAAMEDSDAAQPV